VDTDDIWCMNGNSSWLSHPKITIISFFITVSYVWPRVVTCVWKEITNKGKIS